LSQNEQYFAHFSSGMMMWEGCELRHSCAGKSRRRSIRGTGRRKRRRREEPLSAIASP